MNSQEVKQWYAVSDLYELLPIGRNAIYRLVQEEGFPKIRVGRKIVIPVRQFEEWMVRKIGT